MGFAELRQVLEQFAVVKYVDLDDDYGTATVRFATAAGAAKCVAECEEINGVEFKGSVMDAEAEAAYKKIQDEKRAARDAQRQSRDDGRDGRRYSKGRGRGRGIGRGRGGRKGQPIRGRGIGRGHYG